MKLTKSVTSQGFQDVYVGSEYQRDELEFMQAVESYKKTNGRRFPSTIELLKIAKALGYRLVAEPVPLPVNKDRVEVHGS